MTFTHEIGHMIGGWIGGATLTNFDIAPWRLPFSVHNPDPSPRLTLWAGPILGVVVPGLIALLFRHQWLVFVADFCLLANGGYLAIAWLSGDPFLDTPRLLEAGASPVTITIYCALTIGIGYLRFRRDCIDVLALPVEENDDTNSSPTPPDARRI
jgi:hypothetical protein